tara:strand:+ start:301 stop:1023 length:723 start_codon:yes stop_codon:yes gene_type:complete
MKVIDNFLPRDEFREIQQIFQGKFCPWTYCDDMSKTGDPFYHFEHYLKSVARNQFRNNFSTMEPVCRGLELKEEGRDLDIPVANFPEVFEIQALLLPKSFFRRDTGFAAISRDPEDGMKTGMYFINNNNGYTLLERPGMQNNEKVKSIENRMVILDQNERVSHSTCTNAKRRLIVYFNWVPNGSFKVERRSNFGYRGANEPILHKSELGEVVSESAEIALQKAGIFNNVWAENDSRPELE